MHFINRYDIIFVFLLGKFFKYDNIISLPPEAKSFRQKFYSLFTTKDASLSDADEFQLCLEAFLPERSFNSISMENLILDTQHIIDSLQTMNFTVTGHPYNLRFSDLSHEEKLKVKQALVIECPS